MLFIICYTFGGYAEQHRLGMRLLLGSVEGLALGVAVGASVGCLTGALFGKLKIPMYENEIIAGKFALMTKGTLKEQEKALQVLKSAGHNIYEVVTV